MNKEFRSIVCTSTLEVTVGQFHDGEITSTGIGDFKIEPGNSDSFPITIKNTGNGPDSFSVSISANEPSGWSHSFDSGNTGGSANSISVEQGQTVNVNINVSVPLNALADEAVVYEIKLVRNGDTLDSDNIAVYAGEKHGIDLGVSVTTQSGKDGATYLIRLQ